jgi:hypothetical protein
MHPPPVQSNDHLPAEPPILLEHLHLDRLKGTIHRSPRGKATGYLADSPIILLKITDRSVPSASTEPGTTLHQHLISLFLSGGFTDAAWNLERTNFLMALHKDVDKQPNKLRPIGIGSSFRWLMSRHIAKVHADCFTTYFVPFQYAIGVSGGLDFVMQSLLHASQFLYNDSTSSCTDLCALVRLDFTNMFNSISRKTVREELTLYFPWLLYQYDQQYSAEGNLVWYQRDDGVWESLLQLDGFAQGDPLAPFYSCLALQRLLRALDGELRARALMRGQTYASFPVAYMDDTTLVAHLQDVAFIFDYIARYAPP